MARFDAGRMNLSTVKEYLLSEKFWLPGNVTWEDFEDDAIHIPKIRELWVWIPTAFLFLTLRFLWERYVAVPIGRMRGVSAKVPRQPKPNAVLEKAFFRHKKHIPDETSIAALSKQTDMTPRQIDRWWRLRKVCEKPSEMHRLGETSFRLVAYTFMFIFGIYVLWGKSYIWDTRHCWYNYPKHDITSEYLWYNSLLAGFYISLLVFAVCDNRQKDFYEMMLHHCTTLSMLLFCWHINFVRVSVLMAVIHDCADPFIDAAKMAKYLKFEKLPDVFFVLFAVVWIISRMVVLPMWIGYTSFFEGFHIIGLFPGYCLMAALYLVLQVLHFYWFTFIAKVIYHFIVFKEELRDSRSDTEPDSESEDEMTEENNNIKKKLK